MLGAPGGMKDGGGQQSRFKWLMEGHSPNPPPPDTAPHKNGELEFAPLDSARPAIHRFHLRGEVIQDQFVHVS